MFLSVQVWETISVGIVTELGLKHVCDVAAGKIVIANCAGIEEKVLGHAVTVMAGVQRT